MAGLVILIFLVSTFSTKDSLASEAKGVVCECCGEKYGLECGVSDNGVYGDWEYCIRRLQVNYIILFFKFKNVVGLFMF